LAWLIHRNKASAPVSRYTEKASRPFDKLRDGFVIAKRLMFVLRNGFGEETRRGNYGELTGRVCPMTRTYHGPAPEGRRDTIRAAAKDAG
jgi:3-oxoacyl-(acyl-carrier-protein) synthase